MSRAFTVEEADDGIRLDRWVKRHLPDVPFVAVAKWARTGRLRLDGAPARPGDRIHAGQTITLPEADDRPPRARARESPPLSPDEEAFARSLVLHRSDHALVLNKPPGLATQGGTGTMAHVDRLLEALRFGARERPRLVHRLDRDTSGVLLVARSARAAAFFSQRFAQRDTRKIYWALLMGVPRLPDLRVELPIARQPGTGGEKMQVDEARGSPAVSRIRVMDRAGDRVAFAELRPITGRTHQLRVHAAAIGHPIVGDGKYGGRAAFLTGGVSRKLHLHARRLVIDLPEGGRLDVTAPLPAHFAQSLELLGLEPDSEGA
ncbi:MAG: RluA family pseudouridine synthase [Sphingomonadaceae bacterium]|uniref:RluA family pseudouridine synthase n=1 Tax=Thermaurantiacus sp. TaxID=2820283 RepID=UPI00298EED53|nr:RluA family pseudouridine synthase [Thermaurantiacus sp.]MCS6987312.1 RluA family pseudouridine synthase [Sphingomonadaceae bacterium]MDW8414533.1 RluA family pseudouridine synthase [Thermaurantiacus sp.]